MKICANESIVTHVNSFCDIVGKLQEIELTVTDEMLAIILLSSLNDSFENFVVVIELRDVLPNCLKKAKEGRHVMNTQRQVSRKYLQHVRINGQASQTVFQTHNRMSLVGRVVVADTLRQIVK